MKARWIFGLLFFLFVWLVISRFTEVQKLAMTLAQGRMQWVLIATLAVVVYYSLYTLLYQVGFYVIEIRSRFRELFAPMFASVFMNVAAPSGGASASALFIDAVARNGESPTRAAAGTLLVLIGDYAGFSLVLVAGMGYLFYNHFLRFYQIAAAALLLLIMVGMSAILMVGLWRPSWLRSIFAWLVRLVERIFKWFKRPSPLSEEWGETNAGEFLLAADLMRRHPGRMALMIVISVTMHLVNIFCLYCIFEAYHQRTTFGVLVAGYSMGMLFWIVSITPQGIGVVEGVMALVFTSLGVPPEPATVISLAFRGLVFWLPFFLGFILLQRVPAFGAKGESLTHAWGVRFSAILTALTGVMNILFAVTPAISYRLRIIDQYLPLDIRNGSRLTAALAGFALLVLAWGLWRYKRLAWVLTLVVLGISALSYILKGLDYEEAFLSIALMFWLISLRSSFHARSDPPSVRRGFLVVGAAFLATLLYTIYGFYLLHRQFSTRFDFPGAVRQAFSMFFYFNNPGLLPITPLGRFFVNSIYILAAATMGYALLMLIRPVLVRWSPSNEEYARAKAIVKSFGRSSLAGYALLHDKIYFFSEGGSLVAYQLDGRVALALGDPIGPLSDLKNAILGFRKLCEGNDWQPAFYQVKTDFLEEYHQTGFRTLEIGKEAIIHLNPSVLSDENCLEGRPDLEIMQARGYEIRHFSPVLNDDTLEELRVVSDAWLEKNHDRELRYSLGWFDEDVIRSSQIASVCRPDGKVLAFVSFLPEGPTGEIGIDLLRYRPGIDEEVLEFLLDGAIQWSKERGYKALNLGINGLDDLPKEGMIPNAEQVLRPLYEHIHQYSASKGSRELKDKFSPSWSHCFLVFPGITSLPSVSLAVIQAETGEPGWWKNLWQVLGRFRLSKSPK